jgi:hypothetical protein
MKISLFPSLALILWVSSLSVAVAQVRGPVEVETAAKPETSEPIRNIRPLPPQRGQHAKPVYHIPHVMAPAEIDPVVQTQAGSSSTPPTAQNFDGVGKDFAGPQGSYSVDAAPPDTNGAVGATQYVQWVNDSFAIFDKTTGAVV